MTKLKQYQWEGLNRYGQIKVGLIEATNIALAKNELRKQGIITRKISKKRTVLLALKYKKIKQGDITLFSRQLATLIAAGIPLLQALDILAKGRTQPALKQLLESIKRNIESSLTLAEALTKHPEFFNDLFCNLIDAGEKSGTLDSMLDKIATYKEKTETIKKKIQKALTYPIAISCLAFLVTLCLLVFVVPQFAALFSNFGAQLPLLTLSIMALSLWFQSYWYFILLSIVGMFYSLSYANKHSDNFGKSLDRLKLMLPILGLIFKYAAISRFSRSLSITFAAGLPLVDALKSVAGVTGNRIFAEATEQIRMEIAAGQAVKQAMDHTQLFPSMVINMVAIGEESGKLELMLGKIADFYETEVNQAVDSLCSLLEPLIMSVLGLIVAVLVIAMYLPMIKLGSII